MGIPQILMIIILSLSTVVGIVNHGKVRYGFHDGVSTAISNGIVAAILYAGGFWN